MTVEARSSDVVGREAELDVLRALFRGAAGGHLRAAIVEGEAGIGKTRLLEEALADPSAVRFRVFRAKCDEYEQQRAFAPLATALGCRPSAADQARAEIAQILDGRTATDPGVDHFRLVDRFIELIETEALQGPIALVLDDVHWADEASIAVLRVLPRRLPFVALALVLGHRPVSPGSPLGKLVTLLEDEGATRLVVRPLGDADVTRLATQSLGAPPDASLQKFLAGAAGNPLFVRELLAALEQEGSVRVSDGRAAVLETLLPPTLRLTIIRRISYLPPECLEVLRGASVLGSAFDPLELAACMQTSVSAVAASLDACVSAGTLTVDGELYRFRHDLIREALYLDRPPGVRAALHVEAARALADLGAPVARVAEQYALGARPGDREAIEALHRAASSERSAITRVELLERAAALCEREDVALTAIRADLAEALASAGRPDDACSIARELLRSAAAAEFAPRMRAVLAQSMRLGGRWVDLAELVAGWLDGELDETERTEMLATAAYAAGISAGSDPAESERLGREALIRAEATREPSLIIHACVATLWSAVRRGADDAAVLVERAAALAESTPSDQTLRMQPHWHLGRLLLDTDPEAAERAFRTGLRLAEEYGRVADAPLYLDGLAHAAFLTKRWDDAVAEAEAAVSVAEESRTRMWAIGSHALLAHIAILRGDVDAAERHIAAEETLARELGPQVDDASGAHRAMLDELRGDLQGALERRWKQFEVDARGRRSPNWFRCLWLALEMDDRQKAIAVVVHLENGADSDFSTRQAKLARSMLEGDAVGVADHVDALWATSGIDHERAALALARVGRHDDARRHQARLAEELDAVGAHVWLDMVARHLQRHGMRAPRRRRASRPASGWDALTPTERRVAQLAAEGLTNPRIGERLYVSPRTVQTHLAHVFAKLGIGSRVELAAEVARRGRDVE